MPQISSLDIIGWCDLELMEGPMFDYVMVGPTLAKGGGAPVLNIFEIT